MCGVRHEQLARAAGTSCTLIKKDRDTGYATLRLQSGELRVVRLACMATVGVVSNKVRPPPPLASFFVAPSQGHRFASCPHMNIHSGCRRASPYPLSRKGKSPVSYVVCARGGLEWFGTERQKGKQVASRVAVRV